MKAMRGHLNARASRRWRFGGRAGDRKVRAIEYFDDEEDDEMEGEKDQEEHEGNVKSGIDPDMPKWMRFKFVNEKKYWDRPMLGGDETPQGMISFILDVLSINGTVIRRCWVPALASALTAVIVTVVQGPAGRAESMKMALPVEFFLPYVLITVFVLGFRLFAAWQSYRKGHEYILQICSSTVDSFLACTTSIHVRNSGMDMLEMIRRFNVLAAFIRQDLRESRHHIMDHTSFKAGWRKGEMAKEWFFASEEKFTQDRFGAPPLKLLLTPGEVAVYKNHSPQDRVIVCTIAIRTLFAKHVYMGEKKMSTPDSKLFQKNVENIIHCWGKCRELVRTPPPFVLHHLGLLLALSVAILFAPLYFVTNHDGWFPVLASAALTFALYSIEEAASEMEVPFGWRASDTNLTKMCRTILKRSLTFCKICKVSFAKKNIASPTTRADGLASPTTQE